MSSADEMTIAAGEASLRTRSPGWHCVHLRSIRHPFANFTEILMWLQIVAKGDGQLKERGCDIIVWNGKRFHVIDCDHLPGL